MLKKIKRFWSLEWQQKVYFVRAYFLLGIMRAAVLLVSFKRLSRSLQHHPEQVSSQALDGVQLEQAEAIGWAVNVAAHYTPWNSNCLAQALTAQRMLSQKHIPGMFFLGVKKNQQQLDAHAWLQCDEIILTGRAGHEAFTVVSSFSW